MTTLHRRSSLILVLGASILVGLAGCDSSRGSEEPSLETRMTQIDVDSLETEVARLETRIAQLESASTASTNYDDVSFAILGNPTEPGFSLGRTGFGKFAVTIEDIQPYGSGSRLTLKMLNLAGATLNNATFTVNYNQLSARDRIEQANASDPNAAKYRPPSPVTHRSNNVFPPNQWVLEVVNLPDLAPANVKFVAVQFAPTAVIARP